MKTQRWGSRASKDSLLVAWRWSACLSSPWDFPSLPFVLNFKFLFSSSLYSNQRRGWWRLHRHCSLAPPAYVRPLGLRYYVLVCGIFAGYLRPNFAGPISEQREWLRTMTLRLCPSLRCSQTLAIGYGRSRVALGTSNSFKLQHLQVK